jgi:hypothetical protein
MVSLYWIESELILLGIATTIDISHKANIY